MSMRNALTVSFCLLAGTAFAQNSDRASMAPHLGKPVSAADMICILAVTLATSARNATAAAGDIARSAGM